MLVDKKRRLQAVEVVRAFMRGEITNFDFEERFPSSSWDLALSAISNMLWFFYDDFKEHKLDMKQLPPEARSIIERAILFLQTEIDYTGPTRFHTPETAFPKDTTTLARVLDSSITTLMLSEPTPLEWNPSTWPFENEEQLRIYQQS